MANLPERMVGMSRLKAKFERVPVFWIAGLVLICMISSLIANWPSLSDRVDRILESFKYILIGIFLPLLWVDGKKAKRHEKILMFFVMMIPVSGFLYWFHFRVVTIRVVGNSYGSLESELHEFNNSHSRIKAELVYDWSQLDTNERFQKFRTYLKGHDEVDLIEIDDIWMNSAIDRKEGGLLPLDMFFERDMGDRNFLSASIEMARQPGTGKLYGIPLYINAGLIFYRKDLIGELKRPVPLSHLESSVFSAILQAKNRGLEGIVFQSAQYEGLNCTFYEMLSSVGGSIVDESGKIRVNTPKVKYVLKRMHAMIYRSGVIPSSVLVFKEEESRKLFYSGHAVVLRNWPYVLLKWKDSFPVSREDVGITYWPAPVLGAWYLGITKNSEHPRETWEVIRFMTRSSTQYARATHPDVSRRRLPPDMNLFPKLAMQYDFLPSVEKALSLAKPRPRIQEYQLLSDLLSKAIYSILSDQTMTEESIDTLLDGLQEEFDR